MAKKESDTETLLGEAGNEALERLASQVENAVDLIRELRKERDELDGKVEELQARIDELEDTAGRAKELEKQQSSIEDEKAEIRKRIESILEKFEELEDGD